MRWLHNAYLAVNMLICATLLFPWCEPRETFCGMMGRWIWSGSAWQRAIAGILVPILDGTVHRKEPCCEIARMEAEARRVLYPYDH